MDESMPVYNIWVHLMGSNGRETRKDEDMEKRVKEKNQRKITSMHTTSFTCVNS